MAAAQQQSVMFSAASAAEGTWQAGHSSKQLCQVGQLSQDRSELQNPIPNPPVNYQDVWRYVLRRSAWAT